MPSQSRYRLRTTRRRAANRIPCPPGNENPPERRPAPGRYCRPQTGCRPPQWPAKSRVLGRRDGLQRPPGRSTERSWPPGRRGRSGGQSGPDEGPSQGVTEVPCARAHRVSAGCQPRGRAPDRPEVARGSVDHSMRRRQAPKGGTSGGRTSTDARPRNIPSGIARLHRADAFPPALGTSRAARIGSATVSDLALRSFRGHAVTSKWPRGMGRLFARADAPSRQVNRNG
jgi:hypothetical protein